VVASLPVAGQTGTSDAAGLPSGELIDRDACMGSGNCAYWAPGVFELDEDGVAVVCGDPTGHEERVRMAAQNCPTRAIRFDALSA
jgi:ferredoxin